MRQAERSRAHQAHPGLPRGWRPEDKTAAAAPRSARTDKLSAKGIDSSTASAFRGRRRSRLRQAPPGIPSPSRPQACAGGIRRSDGRAHGRRRRSNGAGKHRSTLRASVRASRHRANADGCGARLRGVADRAEAIRQRLCLCGDALAQAWCTRAAAPHAAQGRGSQSRMMTLISARACNADPRATLALNEIALRSGAEAITPLGQPVCGNAEIPGDGFEALSADEPLESGRLALHRFLAAPALRKWSNVRFETWCFLSVVKASIPCQEIGSHYMHRKRVLAA